MLSDEVVMVKLLFLQCLATWMSQRGSLVLINEKCVDMKLHLGVNT